MTDKERLYDLIYEALETYELTLGELMEVFFMILIQQEFLIENEENREN